MKKHAKDIFAAHLSSEPDARGAFNEGIDDQVVITCLQEFSDYFLQRNQNHITLINLIKNQLNDTLMFYQWILDHTVTEEILNPRAWYNQELATEVCKKRSLTLSQKIMRVWREKNEVLIPVGWLTDERNGHAMLIQLKNTDIVENNTQAVIMSVYNTGSGLKHHDNLEGLTEKYARKMAFTIPLQGDNEKKLELLIADLLIQRIVPYSILSKLHNQNKDERNPQNGFATYDVVLSKLLMFDEVKSVPIQFLDQFSKTQRANSCVTHVYLRWIRDYVDLKYYEIHISLKIYCFRYLQSRIHEIDDVDEKKDFQIQTEKARNDLSRIAVKSNAYNSNYRNILNEVSSNQSAISAIPLTMAGAQVIASRIKHSLFLAEPKGLNQEMLTSGNFDAHPSVSQTNNTKIILNPNRFLESLAEVIVVINQDFHELDALYLLRTIESFIIDLEFNTVIETIKSCDPAIKDETLENLHALFYAYRALVLQLQFYNLPRSQVVLKSIACLVMHLYITIDVLKEDPDQNLKFKLESDTFNAYWFWDPDIKVNIRAKELVTSYGFSKENKEQDLYTIEQITAILSVIFKTLPHDAQQVLNQLLETVQQMSNLQEMSLQLIFKSTYSVHEMSIQLHTLIAISKRTKIPIDNDGIGTLFKRLQQTIAVMLIVNDKAEDVAQKLMLTKHLNPSSHWPVSDKIDFWGHRAVILPIKCYWGHSASMLHFTNDRPKTFTLSPLNYGHIKIDQHPSIGQRHLTDYQNSRFTNLNAKTLFPKDMVQRQTDENKQLSENPIDIARFLCLLANPESVLINVIHYYHQRLMEMGSSYHQTFLLVNLTHMGRYLQQVDDEYLKLFFQFVNNVKERFSLVAEEVLSIYIFLIELSVLTIRDLPQLQLPIVQFIEETIASVKCLLQNRKKSGEDEYILHNKLHMLDDIFCAYLIKHQQKTQLELISRQFFNQLVIALHDNSRNFHPYLIQPWEVSKFDIKLLDIPKDNNEYWILILTKFFEIYLSDTGKLFFKKLLNHQLIFQIENGRETWSCDLALGNLYNQTQRVSHSVYSRIDHQWLKIYYENDFHALDIRLAPAYQARSFTVDQDKRKYLLTYDGKILYQAFTVLNRTDYYQLQYGMQKQWRKSNHHYPIRFFHHTMDLWLPTTTALPLILTDRALKNTHYHVYTHNSQKTIEWLHNDSHWRYQVDNHPIVDDIYSCFTPIECIQGIEIWFNLKNSEWLVSLPRLGLNFLSQSIGDELQFNCQEHPGYYLAQATSNPISHHFKHAAFLKNDKGSCKLLFSHHEYAQKDDSYDTSINNIVYQLDKTSIPEADTKDQDNIYQTVNYSLMNISDDESLEVQKSIDGLQLIYLCLCCNALSNALYFLQQVSNLGGIDASVQDFYLINKIFNFSPRFITDEDNVLSKVKNKTPDAMGIMLQVAALTLNFFIQNKRTVDEELRKGIIKCVSKVWIVLCVEYLNQYRHIPIALRINEFTELNLLQFIERNLKKDYPPEELPHILNQRIIELRRNRAHVQEKSGKVGRLTEKFIYQISRPEILMYDQKNEKSFENYELDTMNAKKIEEEPHAYLNFMFLDSLTSGGLQLLEDLRTGRATPQALFMVNPLIRYLKMLNYVAQDYKHYAHKYLTRHDLEPTFKLFLAIKRIVDKSVSVENIPTKRWRYFNRYTGPSLTMAHVSGQTPFLTGTVQATISQKMQAPDLHELREPIYLTAGLTEKQLPPLHLFHFASASKTQTVLNPLNIQIFATETFTKKFLEKLHQELSLGQHLIQEQQLMIEQAINMLSSQRLNQLQQEIEKELITYTQKLQHQENDLEEGISLTNAPLEIQLKVIGEVIQRFTFDDLFKMYITKDISLFCQYFACEQENAVTCYQKVHQFLLTATHTQYLNRVKKGLADFQRSEKSNADYNKMYTLLTSMQAYNVTQHPVFLYFEYKCNIFLWPMQVKTILSVVESAKRGEVNGKIYQLIMGEGKTSVILLLLFYLLAHLESDKNIKPRLPIAEVPKSLLKTFIRNTQSGMMRIFSYQGFVLEFERNSPSQPNDLRCLYRGLKNTFEDQRYVITSPESIRSIILTFLDQLEIWHVKMRLKLSSLDEKYEQRKKTDEEIENLTQSIHSLQKILQLLRQSGHALIDEVQECLKGSYELNYSMLALSTLPSYVIEGMFYVLEVMHSIHSHRSRGKTIYDEIQTEKEYKADDISLICKEIAQYLCYNLRSSINPLCELLKDFSITDKDSLFTYVLAAKAEEPVFFSKLSLPQKNVITMFRHLLSDILPLLLLKKYRKDYGFGEKGRVDLGWTKFSAIPFMGNNKPQLNSEYFDILQMAMASALAATKSNFSLDFYDKVLKGLYIQEEEELLNNPEKLLNGGQYSVLFRNIFSQELNQDSVFSLSRFVAQERSIRHQQIEKWQHVDSFKIMIIKLGLLTKLLLHQGIMRCNAHNHASAYAFIDSFTATPVIANAIPRMTMDAEIGKGVDGKLIQIMRAKQPKVFQDGPNTPLEFFNYIESKDPDFKRLQAILDCGALFTGIDHQVVAKTLLEKLKATPCFFHIRYLLYFNDNDLLCALPLDDPENIIIVGTTDYEQMKRILQCNEFQWFAYLDEVHNTGVSLKFSPNAHAALTVSRDNLFYQVSQSSLRFRDYFYNQTTAIYLCPNMKVFSSTLTSIDPIIDFLLQRQVEYMLTQNFNSLVQAIENVIWEALFSKLLSFKSEGYWEIYYPRYRSFFIQTISDNFYLEHGGVKKSDHPERILKIFAHNIWQSFNKIDHGKNFSSDELKLMQKKIYDFVADAQQYCRLIEEYYALATQAAQPFMFDAFVTFTGVRFSFAARAVEVQKQIHVEAKHQVHREQQRTVSSEENKRLRSQDLTWVQSPTLIDDLNNAPLPIRTFDEILPQGHDFFAKIFYPGLKFSDNYFLLNESGTLMKRKPIQSVLLWERHGQLVACVISEKEAEVILQRFRNQAVPFALYHPHGSLKCGNQQGQGSELLLSIFTQINFINVDFRFLRESAFISPARIDAWILPHVMVLEKFLDFVLLRQYQGMIEETEMKQFLKREYIESLKTVLLPQDNHLTLQFTPNRARELLQQLRLKQTEISNLMTAPTLWQSTLTRQTNLIQQQKVIEFLITALEKEASFSMNSYLWIRQNYPQAFEGWGMDSFNETIKNLYLPV